MELCKINGHKWFYTEEYAKTDEDNVQADKICERCGKIEIAWTGPTKEDLDVAIDGDIPTKKEVYNQLPENVAAKVET